MSTYLMYNEGVDILKRKKQKAAAQKRYKASLKGKATQSRYYSSQAKRESCRRWRVKNKHKIFAHHTVEKAIKLGILTRQPCEVCNKKNAFAHHDDYSKPLEVRWLCNFHHSEWHRKITL